MDLASLKSVLAHAPVVRCAAPRRFEEAEESPGLDPLSLLSARLGLSAGAAASANAQLPPPTPTVLLRASHAPVVGVREHPRTDAPALAFLRPGDVVRAVARRGGWARLDTGGGALRVARLGAGDEKEDALPAPRGAWVLMIHPEFGKLVEVAKGDVARLREEAAALECGKKRAETPHAAGRANASSSLPSY